MADPLELTDEDHVRISVIYNDRHSPLAGIGYAYKAGLAAGYRRGVEDAAKACDEIANAYRDDGAAICASTIRALIK